MPTARNSAMTRPFWPKIDPTPMMMAENRPSSAAVLRPFI
jgi:hypothetical protein